MKLHDVYESRIIERGEGYIHYVNYCIKIGDFLYSEVEGSFNYKTKVNLATLEGNCSCPYHYNCKHAVATYLIYQQGNFINADDFIKHLKTLSKRELISIIEQSLHNNPDIALNYDLKTSTNYESFVNDFIDDFSYSRMNKAERLASQFTFKQLLRMLNFLFENEDNVFEIIYEDYYDDEEGEVLYYFESVLEKELMKKITNEKEMRQVLAVDLLHDEIINSAEKLLKFKHVIKSVSSKDKFLSFLLHLENPDMTEVKESITESSRHELYHLPPKNIALAERIANHLQDKGLLFLVAVYKDDYKGIINNLSEFNILISEYYWLRRKLSDIVDLFIRHDFKDKKVAQEFLRKDLLRSYNSEQLTYLARQINEYDFVKQKVDFKERFSQNKVLLERLFQLDETKTTILINEEEHIFENKHWTEIVEILSYLREKFGRQYITTLIKNNEDIFKTSSTLKSNLKKKGIFISHIRGVLNVEVRC